MFEPKEKFMHEFKTPINCYTVLCVRHGFNPIPVQVFEGRECYGISAGRIWGGKGRAYHNRMSVHFLDNGEIRNIPGGEWAKKAKYPK